MTYRSNNGKGPLLAECVYRGEQREGFLKMVRWDPRTKAKTPTTFFLPAWFLSSPSCGWKAVRPEGEDYRLPCGHSIRDFDEGCRACMEKPPPSD